MIAPSLILGLQRRQVALAGGLGTSGRARIREAPGGGRSSWPGTMTFNRKTGLLDGRRTRGRDRTPERRGRQTGKRPPGLWPASARLGSAATGRGPTGGSSWRSGVTQTMRASTKRRPRGGRRAVRPSRSGRVTGAAPGDAPVRPQGLNASRQPSRRIPPLAPKLIQPEAGAPPNGDGRPARRTPTPCLSAS